MHEGVQARQPIRRAENALGQRVPVDPAIGPENLWAKLGHHAVVRLASRLKHLVAQLIGLDQKTAPPGERFADEGLAAGQPPG